MTVIAFSKLVFLLLFLPSCYDYGHCSQFISFNQVIALLKTFWWLSTSIRLKAKVHRISGYLVLSHSLTFSPVLLSSIWSLQSFIVASLLFLKHSRHSQLWSHHTSCFLRMKHFLSTIFLPCFFTCFRQVLAQISSSQKDPPQFLYFITHLMKSLSLKLQPPFPASTSNTPYPALYFSIALITYVFLPCLDFLYPLQYNFPMTRYYHLFL